MPELNIQIVTNVAAVEVGADPVVEIVELGVVGAQGPQGIQGIQGIPGPSTLSGLTDVNVLSKVDKSVLVFDQGSNKFVANDVNTVLTIADGGNF